MKTLAEFSDRELLERIYSAQLRLMMDVEKTQQNVALLIGKYPELLPENYSPHSWRHMIEINETMERAHKTLQSQLERGDNLV